MTQFRFEGLGAAEHQAAVFNYKGAQFPWCTVSFGRSSGCCSGKGGFELCLEQHITPDVGFAMGQYWRATGDKHWLAEIGFPIAQGVAEWVTSRVSTGADGSYHINRVMPVDEWCDNTASSCGSTGVNDDPQMNGASVAALRFAVEAALVLGEAPDPRWTEIAKKLVIPYGNFSTPYSSYEGVHLMPPKTVPFETVMLGGQPFSATNLKAGHGSVCPEDVMYLSYPMGPALDISTEVTSRDLDAWIGSGMTCLENGGMTHPIRLVSFLMAQQHNASYRRLAEQALNGTMYGCCYGPYNLRNEIDRHNTTVGGHGSNTHFVTGDGGFINSFVSGFGGLMLGTQHEGLRLMRPTVPAGTGGLRFRGLDYQGGTLDYEFTEAHIVFTATEAGVAGPLCVVDGSGRSSALKASGTPTVLPLSDLIFPAALGLCQK
jgi:hypothetical protein